MRYINLGSLYLRSPIFLQHIFVSLEGFHLQYRRYGSSFQKFFSEALYRDRLERGSFSLYQEKRLRNFLAIAREAPFWRDRFDAYNVNLNARDIFSEIKKLPILSKEEVKKNSNAIRVPRYQKSRLLVSHTSGTTGSGLIFFRTKDAEKEQGAVWWRHRMRFDMPFNEWCGYFCGRTIVSQGQTQPPFWRINYPGRQLLMSIYHLSKDTVRSYIDILEKYHIRWIHGYPSVLVLFARLLQEYALKPPQLRWLTTSTETLFSHQRTIIETVFKVPIIQHYGQAEGVADMSECENYRLHVDEDFSFVEFVPFTFSTSSSKIIGTNWTNPAFPLIRYDTGDIATVSSLPCTCGRWWRTVTYIDGRKEDYVVLPNGVKIGRLDHIFKDLVHVREAQIYQNNPSYIVFRIVKGHDYDTYNEEELLLMEARQRLGDAIQIQIEYVDKIQRTAFGKLRFVISEIPSMKIGS